MTKLGLILCLSAAAACGKGEAKASADTEVKEIDCAAFATRMMSCEEDFWGAYAGSEMARLNAPSGDVAHHVADVRILYAGQPGAERFCHTMNDMFGLNKKWAPRAEACAKMDTCSAWAACAGPAISSAAR